MSTEKFLTRIRALAFPLIQHKREIFFVLALEAILALLNALIPYFTKLQIDQLEQQTSDFLFLSFSPAGIFVLFLLIPVGLELLRLALFERISSQNYRKLSTDLRLSSERQVWKKLETLDLGFFQNTRNQRLVYTGLRGADSAEKFFSFLQTRISTIIGLAAIIPLLGLVSWQLLVLVLITTVLQTLINQLEVRFQRTQAALEEKQREKYWRLENALEQNFAALKILGATQQLIKNFENIKRDLETYSLQYENQRHIFDVLKWFVRNGMLLLANIFVGIQVLQGDVSIGTFTLVVSYTLQLNSIFSRFFDSIQEWQELQLVLDRLEFFLSLKPRIRTSPSPVSPPATPYTVKLESVHFRYPDFFAEEREYLKKNGAENGKSHRPKALESL